VSKYIFGRMSYLIEMSWIQFLDTCLIHLTGISWTQFLGMCHIHLTEMSWIQSAGTHNRFGFREVFAYRLIILINQAPCYNDTYYVLSVKIVVHVLVKVLIRFTIHLRLTSCQNLKHSFSTALQGAQEAQWHHGPRSTFKRNFITPRNASLMI
jgi:hypothetical protein